MTPSLSPSTHLGRVLDQLEPMPAFPQPLMECFGLAAAEDVHAAVALPGFDNSSMDGYAVRWQDVNTASEDRPIHLPVVGEIAAGQARLLALPPATAIRIMTGAPIPTGADTVVPYEWTDHGATQVRVFRAPELAQHVRPRGDDVAEGALVIAEGTVLGPRELGLLASVGRATVSARPRPRVVVISTGAELREPGQPLAHDSIYDANSYLLAAAVRAAGAICYRVGIVGDEPKEFLSAVHDQLVRADLVVTSGGVSMGDYDVVKAALAPEGVWFGEVDMQPGRPQGFGLVGDDRIPLFALPGNPVSAYVSFELFVLPALRKLMGIAPYARPTVPGELAEPVTSPAGRVQYRRGLFADGRVTPVGGAGSHLLGGLVASNCLFVVPLEATSLEAGAQVEVLLLDDLYSVGAF